MIFIANTNKKSLRVSSLIEFIETKFVFGRTESDGRELNITAECLQAFGSVSDMLCFVKPNETARWTDTGTQAADQTLQPSTALTHGVADECPALIQLQMLLFKLPGHFPFLLMLQTLL